MVGRVVHMVGFRVVRRWVIIQWVLALVVLDCHRLGVKHNLRWVLAVVVMVLVWEVLMVVLNMVDLDQLHMADWVALVA